MGEKFILKGEDQQLAAIKYIEQLKLTDKKVYQVVISVYRRSISDEQRGLYWQWIGIIANELGYEKDEQHLEFKKLYLLPIFYENLSGNHEKLVAMVNAINNVPTTAPSRADLFDGLYHLLSITKANTKEMAEFMNRIYRECTNPDGLGIYLPLPPSSGVM